MRSNYKKLGRYIREVSEKNTNGSVEVLLGVGIGKEFIKSKANTIGSDMTKYKVVSKSQFVYGPVTSRNGDKIAIALLKEKECIISTSYIVFEVIDNEDLLPEYLMMWFRRPEFDRYARYKSHGSAREVFTWEEMCDVELPVPPIGKQREIVREYEVITDRIALNEKMSEKLEETAQALYKHWFVDFEFPMPAEYAESIGKPELTGKPYKSNGGEMKHCEKLDCEIPVGFSQRKLGDFMSFSSGKARPSVEGVYPTYGGNGVNGSSPEYNISDSLIIGRVGENCGNLHYVQGSAWITDNALIVKETESTFFDYYTLKNLKLNSKSEGSGQPLLTQGILNKLPVLKVDELLQERAEKLLSEIFLHSLRKTKSLPEIKIQKILLSSIA